ncbi:YHYH protein [Sanguibacter antarcticus]|uniref:YHYH protein n=1 Tax=Sanguibacter antarcticus TaxID=372484 RepID=A0A2A9E736_9MICO|nr:YHYH protein [Sanguibacter antarcticus]PFG34456.1 YHYH protein [Sanguibacter antarcticus]
MTSNRPVRSRGSLLVGGALASLVLAACSASTSEDATATTTASAAGETTGATEGSGTTDPMSLFDDGALTSEATTVDCTVENGSETTCYQVEVSSLPSTVETDGPYCPATTSDVGGIWVWDGEEPGLYALDENFWDLMTAQGYEFASSDGAITVTDPAEGAASSSTTENSCLEATADGTYHLQVLLPVTPENLDSPTDLSTISQVGLALDGVTIFGDAPSVADRGGLPALDTCGGHIDPSGYYHWHFGAESIQTNLDEAGAEVTCAVDQDVEALLGFSFDGYAIYGPEEDRTIPDDLDECSGHVSETADFGEVYHYHLTYDSPNLPACRVGAMAESGLTSPDNDQASLPSGDGPGAAGPGADGPGAGGPPPAGG